MNRTVANNLPRTGMDGLAKVHVEGMDFVPNGRGDNAIQPDRENFYKTSPIVGGAHNYERYCESNGGEVQLRVSGAILTPACKSDEY